MPRRPSSPPAADDATKLKAPGRAGTPAEGRELRARGQLLKQCDGLPRGSFGVLIAARAPQDLRKRAERHALPADGAQTPMYLDRTLECVDAVGAFDERFGSYAEDIDYGLRARDHGWEVLVLTTARAWGLGSSSANSVRDVTANVLRREFDGDARQRRVLLLAAQRELLDLELRSVLPTRKAPVAGNIVERERCA